ncbi:MAG: CBS domain-containing protein [Bacteroidales bacterium]|nr:CBS domain-containing protein [Bacteroidales bacterium]
MESSGIRLKHVIQFILPSTGVLGLFIAFLLISILPEININLEQNRDEAFQLIAFSGGITIILILILFYLVRRAILSEQLKDISSEELVDSKEKYKALLETSPEGIVMIVDEKPVYANMIFQAMTGCTEQEILEMNYTDLFTGKSKSEHSLPGLFETLDKSGKTINFEAKINSKNKSTRDIVVMASRITYLDKEGILFIVKDITGKEKIGIEEDSLSDELQSSLLLMNLPVSSFMKETVTCNMNQPVVEAGKLMNRRNQDAILITQEDHKHVGIVTDSDLRDRVVAGERPTNNPVFEVMSSPLVTISDQSLLFEASLLIEEKKISHLPVINKNGDIIGIFSKNDLHEIQRNSISYIIKEIRNANTVEGLKAIHGKVPGLVKTLMDSGAKIHNITHLISTITDAITERVIEYAIEEMGDPPVKFAFLVLGSEGRREQTLVTDQDNAIIFENIPNDKLSDVNKYFLYLGKKVNLWLDRIGYNYCKGEIMAGNPQWCQSMDRWKQYFSRWINETTEDASLGVSIFFDFRVVYGEQSYAGELRKHVSQVSDNQTRFFQILSRETSKYKLPVNIFKNGHGDSSGTITETMDIKTGIMPITDFARIYSLYHRFEETNTISRLLRMFQRSELSKSEFDEINHSYNFLMEIRFRNQLAAILNNEIPKNIITSNDLTEIEKSMIRNIYSMITPLQSRLNSEVKWSH